MFVHRSIDLELLTAKSSIRQYKFRHSDKAGHEGKEGETGKGEHDLVRVRPILEHMPGHFATGE